MPSTDLTIRQASERCSLSIYTLRRRIKDRSLRARKPTGCRDYLINVYDFRAFLSGRRIGTLEAGMPEIKTAGVASSASE